MATQTKDPGANARPASAAGQSEATGFEAATAATASFTEQARDAAVAGTRQVQDSVLGVLRQGRDGLLTATRMWTESLGRLPAGLPFGGLAGSIAPAAEAVGGGYDLLEQLIAAQRRFVDQLIAEQRRFAVQVLATATDATLSPERRR